METTQKNDEIEIDVLELLHVLWSKALVIALATALAGMVAMLVTRVFLTPQYQSTTKMYILAQQDNKTLTNSDLQASEQLTQDCAEMIQSRQVAEAAISQLGLDLTAEELLEKVTVTTSTDTRIVTIDVQDEDPYLACDIANAVRNIAADTIQNVMNIEAANVFEEANIPETPISPSTMRNTLIGAILGFIIAVAAILISYLMNDTIRTSDDVERYLHLSTLGTIPLAEGEEKNKKKNKAKRMR